MASHTASLTAAEVTTKTVAAHKTCALAYEIECAKWAAFLVDLGGVSIQTVFNKVGSVLKKEFEALVSSMDADVVASKQRACIAGDAVVKMIALRRAAVCAQAEVWVAQDREAYDLAGLVDSDDEDMIDLVNLPWNLHYATWRRSVCGKWNMMRRVHLKLSRGWRFGHPRRTSCLPRTGRSPRLMCLSNGVGLVSRQLVMCRPRDCALLDLLLSWRNGKPPILRLTSVLKLRA